MNERIRELVKEAGGDFWQRIESDGALNKEAYVTFDPPESLERFALLIVKECIRVVDDTMTENREMNIGLVMASAAIVSHFEVEE